MRYLLIGNGPSALSQEMGTQIDAFDGQVVRFNVYHTKGFEKQVGTRTDVWATISDYPPRSQTHKERWWTRIGVDPRDAVVRDSIGAKDLGPNWRKPALESLRGNPSSGVNVAAYLLSQGHEVVLWGFDYMSTSRKHHYGDGVERGTQHDWFKEWVWFNERLADGRISYLGWDAQRQGCPAVRLPFPCGRDGNIKLGREPAQMGWYAWAADRYAGLSVLDVGAGTCEGLKVLERKASVAHGMDTDPRLAGIHPRLSIASDLSGFATKSVDVITSIDAIEHIVDDLVFMRELKRIARREIFITTPNGHRSQCVNGAHCREYTIPQFANVFCPDEVWSGSPDGNAHLTLVLKREGDVYVNYGLQGMGNRKPMPEGGPLHLPVGHVPLTTRFNCTVDGEEWAHITAVFKLA